MADSYRTALVVIARDESARIERLLGSVRPWVDQMWVLDTGSRDDTPQRARAAGAQVAHFDWCDDFSAARNHALQLADADWHLVLDADEWLEQGGEQLAALRQQAPDFVGSVLLQDHTREGPDGTAQRVCSRLSRVLPGRVRYQGRIHEQPVHALPLRELAVTVGHDGYLPEALRRKSGRNRALLEVALREHPGEAYLWYQLAKDGFVYDDHALAEQGFARAAALGAATAGWWPDLAARRLFSLKQLKRHEQGMDFAESQLQRCADSPDFFFALGDLLLDFAADHPERGDELLPVMEQAWRRCLEIGERPDQPGAVAGRGSWLAAHNLALVLDFGGRADEARAVRLAHPAPAAPGASGVSR